MRGLGSVELWDLASSSFRVAPSLPHALLGEAVVATAKGEPVIAGGVALDETDDPGGLQGRVDRLDLDTLEWHRVATMGLPRYLHRAAPLGAGRWLIVGGLVHAQEHRLVATSSIEVLDLLRGTSQPVARLPFATAEPLVAPCPDGRILVAGGYGDDVLSEAHLFDPVTAAWTPGPELPRPRAGCLPPSRLGDHHLLFLGGVETFEPATPPAALLLDVRTLSWSEVAVPIPRDACIVPLADGRLLVSGGRDHDGGLRGDNYTVELAFRSLRAAPDRCMNGGPTKEAVMPIQIGERIPDVQLFESVEFGDACPLPPAKVSVAEATKGKRIVIFGLPGAFTPTCSGKHVPGYLEALPALKAKGISEVWCVSVNDGYVMAAWGREQKALGKIRMLGDGGGELAKKLGLTVDIPGMGTRMVRCSMLVDDGVIKQLNVEAPGKFEVSDAATMLKQLG